MAAASQCSCCIAARLCTCSHHLGRLFSSHCRQQDASFMQARGADCQRLLAGKTTLMNALAGKASYGRVTGSIEVNGQPDSLGRYTKVMGFVPQVC